MASYAQTIMNPMAGAPETPAAAKAAREWAALLTRNSQRPVEHWAQGVGNMFQSALGGYTDYKTNEAERAGQQKAVSDLLAALNPQASPTPVQANPLQAPQQTQKFQFPEPPADNNPLNWGVVMQDAPQNQANAPRGLRNNNPGNIEDGPFARNLPGYAGTDGRFAKFASLEAGNAAMDRLLQSYGNRGFNTPESIINRWAPPSDNNPTTSYAGNVAKALGVEPNAILDMNSPEIRQRLMQAITLQENGRVPTAQAALAPPSVPSAAPPASAGVAPPGATPQIDRQALAQIMMNPWASDAMKTAAMQRLMPKAPLTVKEGDTLLDPNTLQPVYQSQKNENKYQVIGKDQFGNDIYGWVNPKTKTTEAVQQVQAQQPSGTGDPNDPNNPQVRPVPPGADPKEWRKMETERVAKLTGSRPQQIKSAEVVTQDINRALDIIQKNPSKTTGTAAQLLTNVGGSDAKNLSTLLDTIKANAAFDKLQAMRAASPTGGALGAVSDQENKLLAAAIGSLEQSQSAEQLQYNLRRVSNIYNDIIHGEGKGPQRHNLETKAQSGTRALPKAGEIINGYRYKGGNPNDESSYEKVQ